MKSRICLQRSKTLKTSSNWTSQETVSQKPYHERALLPSNIDKTLTTRTVSRFQLTLELEVEYLILISFMELAFFPVCKGQRVEWYLVILFPPNFSSFDSFDVGSFFMKISNIVNQFSLKSSLKLMEIRFGYFCRLICKRFKVYFTSDERRIFVRNARF